MTGPDDRFARAVRHKNAGEYEEAVALLCSLLADEPLNADAWYELGLTHSYRVEIEESIEALERAVALDRGSLIHLSGLAKTYAMYGDPENAQRVFERLLALDPFNDGPDAAA